MNWIFEPSAFINGDVLYNAVKKHDDKIYVWDDSSEFIYNLKTIKNPCIFHGSLNTADFIARNTDFYPGSACKLEEFNCSSWYESQKQFLLNSDFIHTDITYFIEHKTEIFEKLNIQSGSIFTRPNSPLKPFSGRVLSFDNICLNSFDYGFYHEDKKLQIVVTSSKIVQKEWRFIIVQKQLITGSEYDPIKHLPLRNKIQTEVYTFAEKVINNYSFLNNLYVLDICESGGKYFLLEYNPFGGADLYFCDGEMIYQSIIKNFGLTTAST